MTVAYLIFVAGLLVVAAAGAFVLATTPTQARWIQDPLRRLRTIRSTCVDQLGVFGGALAVLIAGTGATIIICWPFGRFARRYKPNIDAPVLRWTKKHVSYHGTWHHFNAIATHMGNRPVIKIIGLAAAVIFGLLWAKRGWYIPVLIMAATLGFEKFSQSILAKVVARQPTPLLKDFGTYPSGGCARMIVTYGVVFFLVILTWPQISRRWRVIGWTMLGILAWIEGYTRIYLIKHWMLDVVGGWLFGTLLLLTLIGAISCFIRKVSPAMLQTSEAPPQSLARDTANA